MSNQKQRHHSGKEKPPLKRDMQAKHVEVTSNSLLIGKTVKEAQDYSGGASILAIRKHRQHNRCFIAAGGNHPWSDSTKRKQTMNVEGNVNEGSETVLFHCG